MLIKDMQAGKTVDILIDREDFHYHFVSKIEAVSGYSIAVSAIVAQTNRLFRFEETDAISLIYRVQDRMWKFDSVKGGLAKLEDQPVHTFTSYKEAVSYNRRESFRVPIGENCLMRHVIKEKKEDGEEEVAREEIFDTLLYDLSAGGAGIYTDQFLEVGADIVFELPTNMGLLSCHGNVIREAPVQGRPFRHFYGLSFYQVKAGLDRYLFEKQRLMLQKERGG